jgi:hypothetical protein
MAEVRYFIQKIDVTFQGKTYKYIKYVVVAAYIFYCIVRYSIMARV